MKENNLHCWLKLLIDNLHISTARTNQEIPCFQETEGCDTKTEAFFGWSMFLEVIGLGVHHHDVSGCCTTVKEGILTVNLWTVE